MIPQLAAVKRAPIELRDYQASLESDIYAAWSAGAKDVAAVLPTGGGKTVIVSKILHDEPGEAWAIAHRSELVGQIALALARNGVRHKIVGPTAVIRACVNRQMREVGASFYDPGARVAVCGVDTLVQRKEKMARQAQAVRLWVIDECFPAGTLVDGRPIETLRPGDLVTAFDEKTGRFHRRPVVRLFKNPAPVEMTRIELRSHHVLNCTKGHPFWTRRGWVEAGNLTADDEVLVTDEMHELWSLGRKHDRGSTLPIPETRADILQTFLRLCVSGSGPQSPPKTRSGDVLPDVQQAGSAEPCFDAALSPNWAPLLQQEVLRRVPVANILRDNGGHQPGVCEREDAKAKSHGFAGDTKESIPKTSRAGARPEDTGRKRAAPYGSGAGTAGVVQRTGVRAPTSGKNRTRGTSDGLPESLQNRLRESESENRHRSGRGEPPKPAATGTGRPKNRVFSWSRVGSVSFFKSRDFRNSRAGSFDGYVYNIEVEEFHTYVADGVVVHNCHHITRDNKWGKAVQMFPNARGLGVTATLTRADGKGLGRHADGVFDTMVEGPTQRQLIERDYLTDYKIYAPPSDIDLSAVKIGATGDYSPRGLAKAAEKSRIVGDVVEHYLRLAPGKRGVTFATDVETAGRIADKFNAAGAPAAVVHAGTPEAERTAAVQRLTSGQLLQLVNVDIFGEGFDLPAIEVVSFARPTQSFSLFVQQAGRALRPAPGKSHAIIIDHVGNVVRHATVVERGGELVIELCHRTWTLDAREKRGKREREPGEIPLTTCPECLGSYPRAYPRCLYCGHVPIPAGRGSPEEVDGDLTLLDPQALAELQRRIERVDMDVEAYGNELARKGVPHAGVLANKKRLKKQQDAQHVLRENIAWWAGYQRALGRADGEIYRRFYFRFGTDVRSAQTLNESDALALAEKLAGNFTS